MPDTQTQAQRFLDGVLGDLRDDPDYGDGSTVYAHDKGRTESYLLAGNGPTAWAWFALKDDGEIDHAYIEFIEWSGRALALVPRHLEHKLLEALRRDIANQP